MVTETVDAGGMGEHILQTVKHALKNLLLSTNDPHPTSSVPRSKPAGVVIPGRLKLFAQVVECEHLRAKYKFKLEPQERWPTGIGCKQEPEYVTNESHANSENIGSETNADIPVEFTTRCKIKQTSPLANHKKVSHASNRDATRESNAIAEDSILKNCRTFTSQGPAPYFEFHARKQLNANYDSEDFAHIAHKVLSQPVQVLNVDLNCLDDIERVLNGVKEQFSLTCSSTG